MSPLSSSCPSKGWLWLASIPPMGFKACKPLIYKTTCLFWSPWGQRLACWCGSSRWRANGIGRGLNLLHRQPTSEEAQPTWVRDPEDFHFDSATGTGTVTTVWVLIKRHPFTTGLIYLIAERKSGSLWLSSLSCSRGWRLSRGPFQRNTWSPRGVRFGSRGRVPEWLLRCCWLQVPLLPWSKAVQSSSLDHLYIGAVFVMIAVAFCEGGRIHPTIGIIGVWFVRLIAVLA